MCKSVWPLTGSPQQSVSVYGPHVSLYIFHVRLIIPHFDIPQYSGLGNDDFWRSNHGVDVYWMVLVIRVGMASVIKYWIRVTEWLPVRIKHRMGSIPLLQNYRYQIEEPINPDTAATQLKQNPTIGNEIQSTNIIVLGGSPPQVPYRHRFVHPIK